MHRVGGDKAVDECICACRNTMLPGHNDKYGGPHLALRRSVLSNST
jgi:hypothetical protein